MTLADFDAEPHEDDPHCPSPRCDAAVIWATVHGVRKLLNARPDPVGTMQLRDVGGALPAAISLTVTQRFGKIGRLYSLHEPGCAEAKRYSQRRHK